MITLERVKNERLVGLRDMRLREPSLVSQVHLGWDSAGVQSWGFGVHFQVDSFGGLDTDDELVAGDVFEDSLCDIFELDADFDFGLVQGWEKMIELALST